MKQVHLKAVSLKLMMDVGMEVLNSIEIESYLCSKAV